VRFGDGVAELLREPGRVLLEVGPGRTLASLARRQTERGAVVLESLRHPGVEAPDQAFLLGSLGRLWLAGAEVDWDGFHAHERRRRVHLPLYPFERLRYWIDGRGRPRERTEAPAPQPQPAPAHSRPDLATPWVAPRTETERQLAAIWEEVLGIGPVGIHDDFHELGGHSLLALQVLSRVRQALGTELPLRAVFDAPTVARLAVRLLEGETKAADGETLDEMLARLEELSDEDAEALLASQGGTSGD
jgi:acyl transferase domain-containing protein